MTIEEAIDYFKRSYASGNTDDERQHNEALDMAIKSLEAWEKCREEIKEYRNIEAQEHDFFDEYSDGLYDAFNRCLKIIDKHLKEVEND